MSPQPTLTRSIGSKNNKALLEQLAHYQHLQDAAARKVAALQAYLDARDAQPDLSKVDPNVYRLKAQQAKRNRCNHEGRRRALESPAIEQEFCASGLPSGLGAVYAKLKQIKCLDCLKAHSDYLQGWAMYYACLLFNYEQERADCKEFVQCWLSENGCQPEDLPPDVATWINACLMDQM